MVGGGIAAMRGCLTHNGARAMTSIDIEDIFAELTPIDSAEHTATLDTPDDDDTLMIDLEQLSGEFEAMGRLENGYSL
jgi:hypothetical protein